MLLPQDIVVALKIALADERLTYAELAKALDVSTSQAYSAVNRCSDAGLVDKASMRAHPQAILELALHGVKYVYPAELLPPQRGIPTGYSAAPLKERIRFDESVVWPAPKGTTRGVGLVPIHHSALAAAATDERLYEALALIDAIRMGRSRERKIAEDLLTELLSDGKRGSE